MIKRLIKQSLLRRGVVLSRPPGQFNVADYKLHQARDRGLKVGFAIDGGAATGEWTLELRSIYPDAKVLMIEPRADAAAALAALVARDSGLSHEAVALGSHDGTITFNVHGPQSSMLGDSAGRAFGQSTQVEMTTLDGLIRRKGLPYPDLIKLDLQGAEIAALEGAAECLKHTESLILEVSFVPFQKGLPLFADVVWHMENRGFRCYDILALWHRPIDGALAQGDLLFLRNDSKLLQDHRWSTDADWS